MDMMYRGSVWSEMAEHYSDIVCNEEYYEKIKHYSNIIATTIPCTGSKYKDASVTVYRDSINKWYYVEWDYAFDSFNHIVCPDIHDAMELFHLVSPNIYKALDLLEREGDE